MAEDKFDRLLEAMPRIAESVNAFTSKDVQRSAFQALMAALGLGINGDPRTVSRSTDVDDNPDESDTGLAEGNEDAASSGPETTPARRRASKRTSGGKRTFNIPRGMHFAPPGKPSLEDFVKEKQPRNQHEFNLAAVYYLTTHLDEANIDVGKVLAVYKAAGWTAPSQPDTSLRNTASHKGWIDTADMKAIKLVWAGENYVDSKMPQPAAAKKA